MIQWKKGWLKTSTFSLDPSVFCSSVWTAFSVPSSPGFCWHTLTPSPLGYQRSLLEDFQETLTTAEVPETSKNPRLPVLPAATTSLPVTLVGHSPALPAQVPALLDLQLCEVEFPGLFLGYVFHSSCASFIDRITGRKHCKNSLMLTRPSRWDFLQFNSTRGSIFQFYAELKKWSVIFFYAIVIPLTFYMMLMFCFLRKNKGLVQLWQIFYRSIYFIDGIYMVHAVRYHAR